MPREDGKQRATVALGWFLSGWARRLSWKEAAGVFGASWDRVHRAVDMAVAWSRECLSLEGGFPVKPLRWSGNFGQCVKADFARADRSRHGDLHLKSADQLSKQVGPPHPPSRL